MATKARPKLMPSSSSLEMKTELGKKWAERLRVSEAYYKANSADWKALHKLYSSVYAQRNKWGASVSIGWSVVNNLINATYLQNPEPWIRSRRQSGSEGKDRMLRDLFKTIDRDTELETLMERGQVLAAIEGYGIEWESFEQKDSDVEYEAPNPNHVPDDFGPDGVTPGNGEPPTVVATESVVDKQMIRREFVYGHDLRHDPDGREWDYSDHKWLARIYTRSLQYFVDAFEQRGAESGFTANGIKMLKQYVAGQRAMRRPGQRANVWSEKEGYQEDDPAYINVSCFEIWSKAEYQVIHIPVGAQFDIGSYDWTDEWREADRYPATMIAYNWRPADEDAKVGFYPVPLLRLVRSHLDNLNRLEALFMESATFDVKKYIAISGILDDTAKARVQDDKNRDWIEIDISVLKKIFPGLSSQPDLLDIKKLFQLLPTESKSADAERYLAAIGHEMEMIREVTGLGALERGGNTDETATATLARSQALSRRTDKLAEASAKIVDRIHEKTFILLKTKQTLPIPYQLATGKDQSVWAEFLAEDLWDMDLIFDHHEGSTRPPNKDQAKLERKEVATVALPVLQAMQLPRETKALMKWWLEVYDMDTPEGLFDDEVPQLAQQVASLVLAVRSGQKDPVEAGNELLNAASALAMAVMSPADVQMVAQQSVASLNNGAPSKAPTSTGSLPSAQSAGQRAHAQFAGAAGAGITGGLPQ